MNKEFFKKCWENKRLHALMVFLIWIFVIGLLMGILMFINAVQKDEKIHQTNIESIEKEDNKEVKDILSYTEKLKKLESSNYEFTYLITKNKDKIKFEGTKDESGIFGYKQDATGIMKYKIENQKVYQMLIDKEIEISNLYDGIDASLLDLNYVIGILNQFSESDVIITEEEFITTYDYNKTQDEEELEIIVIENKEAIEKITISRNNEIYELIFT